MEQVLLLEMTGEGIASITSLKFGAEEREDSLKFFYKHIECDTVDIVRAFALENSGLKGVSLICDDEGLFKEGAVPNIPASLLYGVLMHGQPLVGKVIVCKDVETPDGIEVGGFTTEEVFDVCKRLEELSDELARRIRQSEK